MASLLHRAGYSLAPCHVCSGQPQTIRELQTLLWHFFLSRATTTTALLMHLQSSCQKSSNLLYCRHCHWLYTMYLFSHAPQTEGENGNRAECVAFHCIVQTYNKKPNQYSDISKFSSIPGRTYSISLLLYSDIYMATTENQFDFKYIVFKSPVMRLSLMGCHLSLSFYETWKFYQPGAPYGENRFSHSTTSMFFCHGPSWPINLRKGDKKVIL